MPENIQTALSDAVYRITNLESKVRLMEQNFFNVQERVQLLSKNFLDLKKEVLGRVDTLSQEAHDIEKSASELRKKVTAIEAKITSVPLVAGLAAIQPVRTEMSSDEASRALDDVLKKLEG